MKGHITSHDTGRKGGVSINAGGENIEEGRSWIILQLRRSGPADRHHLNLKKKELLQGEPDDRYEEYDCLETGETLEREITRLGFETGHYEQDETFLEKISRNPPDFVFNIAEGRGTTRGRYSQVPCILESLGIPFSGSDSTAIAIPLDKWLTHHVLAGGGAKVPDLYMFSTESDLGRSISIFEKHSKYIVKPRWEGSSKGVFPDSVVDNPVAMAKRVRRVDRKSVV